MAKKKITLFGWIYLIGSSKILMIPIFNILWLRTFEEDGGIWEFVRTKKYLPPY